MYRLLDSGKNKNFRNYEEKIDLLELVEKSFPVLNEVHEKLLQAIVTDDLKKDLNFLIDMRKRIIVIAASAWYVYNYNYIDIDIEKIAGFTENRCRLF